MYCDYRKLMLMKTCSFMKTLILTCQYFYILKTISVDEV